MYGIYLESSVSTSTLTILNSVIMGAGDEAQGSDIWFGPNTSY